MTRRDRAKKRAFDTAMALIGLTLLWPVMLICLPLAAWSTGGSGIFKQVRVGRFGVPFSVYKLRTMAITREGQSTVTVSGDPRITPLGAFLRKTKLDELPQLWNVLRGDMSLVGPRPDVEGYADALGGDMRRILQLRPGITGPATIKYRDEERILSSVTDPEAYNWEVIYPDKCRLNLEYLDTWSLRNDVMLILVTLNLRGCPGHLA